jgi:hypothetical protein
MASVISSGGDALPPIEEPPVIYNIALDKTYSGTGGGPNPVSNVFNGTDAQPYWWSTVGAGAYVEVDTEAPHVATGYRLALAGAATAGDETYRNVRAWEFQHYDEALGYYIADHVVTDNSNDIVTYTFPTPVEANKFRIYVTNPLRESTVIMTEFSVLGYKSGVTKAVNDGDLKDAGGRTFVTGILGYPIEEGVTPLDGATLQFELANHIWRIINP